MTAEIINFSGVTRLDLEPDDILNAAVGEGLTEVIVMGWDADGDLYLASSKGRRADVNYLIDKAKQYLLEGR